MTTSSASKSVAKAKPLTDVFISYKREERPRVEKLAEALSDLDLKVWFDVDLTPGLRWAPEIERHATRSAALIVCWTEAALQSKWVRREADIGIRDKKLTPLIFDSCELPPDLKKLQNLDFKDWDGAFSHSGFRSMVKRLAELTGKPNLTDKARAISDGRKAQLVFRTREYLVGLATKHRKATYTEARRALGIGLDTLIAALDETANINRIQREPPLCALIVTKKNGLPGRGFFQKHCFLSGAKDPLAKVTFDGLVARVFDHSWRVEA